MVVTANNDQFNQKRLATEIRMLKALIRDLERLLDGDHPHPKELAASPVIDNWRTDYRHAACLVGTFLGHPRLGRLVPHGITSELWYIDPDRRYARTFSRFYRLGKPARSGSQHGTRGVLIGGRDIV